MGRDEEDRFFDAEEPHIISDAEDDSDIDTSKKCAKMEDMEDVEDVEDYMTYEPSAELVAKSLSFRHPFSNAEEDLPS